MQGVARLCCATCGDNARLNSIGVPIKNQHDAPAKLFNKGETYHHSYGSSMPTAPDPMHSGPQGESDRLDESGRVVIVFVLTTDASRNGSARKTVAHRVLP